MNVTIIGLGLIGGSLALALKEKGLAKKIIGVDASEFHAAKAIDLKLVDEIATLNSAITQSQLIIIAIPVDAIAKILPSILDKVTTQIVIDAGSNKEQICAIVKNHQHRKNFVATHPMWGTEFSGPEAAVSGAFVNKACAICDKDDSSPEALAFIVDLYKKLGMHILYMNSVNHDIHTAYISHISHITSFALANTVLEKEKEEDAIFELASTGFEGTVRLAKSNAATWAPIFMQNRNNVLDVLNEHISQLRKFKASLEKENEEYLKELIENANKIKRILG